MADDGKPQPVVLRIKLRYEDADAMAHRFAANVGRAGLFLPTKSIQPVGAEIKFELRLVDDTPALVGLGRVKASREPDPARPRAAFGMAIELTRVTREGRALIMKMLERRKALGLPDVAIPLPDDVDAARRMEVEASGVSGPVTQIVAEPSAPVAAPVLTSPRRPTGPIGVAKGEPSPYAVAALAPEAPRRARSRLEDVIARADSGPVAAIPELDEDVDVASAVLRARALAGSDLDSELASLLDSQSAPLDLAVDAASAELARALGGSAVSRRDRSAGWAPPPAVALPAEPAADPVPVPIPVPAPDPVPVPVPDPVPAAAAAAAADPEPATLFPPEPTPPPSYPRGLLIDDHVDASQFDASASAAASPASSGSFELSDEDIQELEGEHTMIGALPVAPDAYETIPAAHEPHEPQDSLAERLDAELAEAEAEADADLVMDRDAAYAEPDAQPYAERHADSEPAPEGYETLPADEQSLEDVGDDGPVHLTPTAAPQLADDEEEIEEIEAIEDFEILAEADADDADLLTSDGEHDASVDRAPAYQEPEPAAEPEPEPEPDPGPVPGPSYHRRYPEPDFDYGRLDLGDESAMVSAAAPPAPEDDLDRPSNYTIEAAPAPSGDDDGMDFDEPHAGLDRTRDTPSPEPTAAGSADEMDLDSALQDLDVLTPIPGPSPSPSPRPRTAKPRAVSEDGVLIDFDDDE